MSKRQRKSEIAGDRSNDRKALSVCWASIIFLIVIALVSLIIYLARSDAFDGEWGEGEESAEKRAILVAIWTLLVTIFVAIYFSVKDKRTKIGNKAFAFAAAMCANLAFVSFVLFGRFWVEGDFAEGEGGSFAFGLACFLLTILYTSVAYISFSSRDTEIDQSVLMENRS